MRLEVLKKIGKGIITIIFAESLIAFALVFVGVYLLTHKLHLALLFGAMAPASAPAGTAIVLQEYKAKGPLTNTLYAVVGLDDALAIIIYAFASAFARLSMTGTSESLSHIVKGPILEIGGAIFLGGLLGLCSGFFIDKIRNKKEMLAITVAAVFLCSGLANQFHFSLILANLSLGMVFANVFALANQKSVDNINFISLPIYIIFFVVAGAHLQISYLPAMGALGLVYIFCRSVGLIGGAFLGATLAKADSVIRKYLGLGILSQAGVAIGLALMVSRDFAYLGEPGRNLSLLIINTIAATTIVFEILGPLATKYAIYKAGEIGKAR